MGVWVGVEGACVGGGRVGLDVGAGMWIDGCAHARETNGDGPYGAAADLYIHGVGGMGSCVGREQGE